MGYITEEKHNGTESDGKDVNSSYKVGDVRNISKIIKDLNVYTLMLKV